MIIRTVNAPNENMVAAVHNMDAKNVQSTPAPLLLSSAITTAKIYANKGIVPNIAKEVKVTNPIKKISSI
jgi:hypothetical protein